MIRYARVLAALVLVALVALPAAAQSPTFKLAWSQQFPAGGSLVDLQTGTVYTLKVGAAVPVTLVQTCVAGAAGSGNCTAPLPSTLKSGDVLTLTSTNAAGSLAATNTVTMPGLPGALSGFTITITIQVPGGAE